jgi:hypothetical protein
MSSNYIDYCDLAKRSIEQPLLALYACCPTCGGDIGVHSGFARLLDSIYETGVQFCEFHGKNCQHTTDAREWVWTRYFSSKGKQIFHPDVEIENEPVFFEVAV